MERERSDTNLLRNRQQDRYQNGNCRDRFHEAANKKDNSHNDNQDYRFILGESQESISQDNCHLLVDKNPGKNGGTGNDHQNRRRGLNGIHGNPQDMPPGQGTVYE